MFRMNNTWIGNGHTFSMKEIESLPFFKKSTLSHFMVSDPVELNQLLKANCIGRKNHSFFGPNPPLQK